MFSFLCKHRLLRSGYSINVRNSITNQLGFLQNTIKPSPKSFSSKTILTSLKEDEKQHYFTVSYLINSCGLSREIAISKSHKVSFESSVRPDSVLTLLRNHGFTDTHISKLIRACPSLLLSNPKKTLQPKLEFFNSIGFSGDDLAKFLSSNPTLLHCSLKNCIIPFYDFLKSILHFDKKVVAALKHRPRVSLKDFKNNTPLNVDVLRQLGVPQSVITLAVSGYPGMIGKSTEKFNRHVKEVIEMDFDPLRLSFVQALHVMSALNKSTWKYKFEVYKRWGWSENEIQCAFRKHPFCMTVSEKKIMSTMNFLVNEMGFESKVVAGSPIILCYSLEKRIVPRCSVVRVLQLKGLIKNDSPLVVFLQPAENIFLQNFVTYYDEQVPQLLSVYKGKIGLRELGFSPDDIHGKQVLNFSTFQINDQGV